MKQYFSAAIAFVLVQMSAMARGSAVKVTPLGSHDGEFCQFDRAMVFEDPNGTRLVYDVGQIAGVEDPRLGEIDVVLLSYVHGDRLGDEHIPEVNAGECSAPDTSQDVTPLSNTVDIAVANDAKIVVGSEMNSFFSNKVSAAGGDSESVELVRFGQETVVKDLYNASLVVINIGDTFTTDPKEAAFVVNELIEPVSVIPSHANEAATEEGKVIPDTKTDEFIEETVFPVYTPLSGETMGFDGFGTCVTGCENVSSPESE